MTVAELMDQLATMNPEAEVEVQQQQNYPLKGKLVGVCTDREVRQARAEEEGDDESDIEFERCPHCAKIQPECECSGEELETVYLASGEATEYGDRAAWDCCRD